ncbi:hypothetical protein OQA88_7138 [Cercophora sp. LCS_1]
MVNKIFPSLALVAAFATAGPILTDTPIPGYKVEPFTGEIDVAPGEAPVVVAGTIDEAIAEIEKTNPNFRSHVCKRAEKATGVSPVERSSLEPRQEHFCRDRWEEAKTHYIRDGIGYPRGLNGQPQLGPMPGAYFGGVSLLSSVEEPDVLLRFPEDLRTPFDSSPDVNAIDAFQEWSTDLGATHDVRPLGSQPSLSDHDPIFETDGSTLTLENESAQPSNEQDFTIASGLLNQAAS